MKQVSLGSRTVTHGEVLRACLTEGLCAPVVEPLDSQLRRSRLRSGRAAGGPA